MNQKLNKITHKLYAERGRFGMPLGFFHVHLFFGLSSFLPLPLLTFFLADGLTSDMLMDVTAGMDMVIDGRLPFWFGVS